LAPFHVGHSGHMQIQVALQQNVGGLGEGVTYHVLDRLPFFTVFFG